MQRVAGTSLGPDGIFRYAIARYGYLSLEAEQLAREDAAVRAALVRVASHVLEVVEG